MDQIFKSYMGVVMLFLLLFVGIGIISASMDASAAEDFAAESASVIEASNYSNEVISNLKTEAAQSGYVLNITTQDTDGDNIPDIAEVVVDYQYSIPILNIMGTVHHAKAFAK